jgi:hypothetical protein
MNRVFTWNERDGGRTEPAPKNACQGNPWLFGARPDRGISGRGPTKPNHLLSRQE